MIVKRHLLGENFLLPKYKQILRVFVYKPPKKETKDILIFRSQWDNGNIRFRTLMMHQILQNV